MKALDASLDGLISDLIATHEFKAKAGSSVSARVGRGPGSGPKYFALVVVGAADKMSSAPTSYGGAAPLTTLGATTASLAKSNKCSSAAVGLLKSDNVAKASTEQIALGIWTGAYESTRFKSKPNASKLSSVTIYTATGLGSDADAAIHKAQSFAMGTFVTRYLVEAPPNVCTPTHLAKTAKYIADQSGGTATLKVLEKEDCVKLGMGSYLGVAACSAEPPKFIHLTYKPAGPVTKKVR